MRKLVLIVLTLLLSANWVIAQQSDYQIQQNFLQKYESVLAELNTASSVDQIDSISSMIIALRNEFIAHESLLNTALYPNSFEKEMEELSRQSKASEQKLLVIENQIDQLTQLNDQLSSYKSELTILSQQRDSLYKAILKSEESEKNLTKLVRQYRKSLELRDNIILDVIDSLLIVYDESNKISIGEEPGLEKKLGVENPLDLIIQIIEENIEFVSTNNKVLSVEDHLRMYALQRHFQEKWFSIEDNMMKAYAGTNQKVWKQQIDAKIKEWRIAASQKMWASMDQYLEFSDLELEAFDNNYSFFVALDSFIKEAHKRSEEEVLSSDSYSQYKAFQEFWSGKIKNDWGAFIRDADVLTISQISSIDDQLVNWEEEARPVHPMLIVLIVFTAVLLIGFSMAMFKTYRT